MVATTSQTSQVDFCLRDGVVAVNQTRFQKNKFFRNKYLDSRIRKYNSVMILSPWSGTEEQLLYWVIQENSIEIFLQTSLSFILLSMVYAYYCAPYPKWLCVKHEVNMWYLCCMMSFVLEPSTSFFQVLWLILWLYHQIVTDVTVWPIISNPNPNCSKNGKIKSKSKEK